MPFFDSVMKGVSSLVGNLFDASKFKVEVRVEKPNFQCMHLASPYPGESGAITGFVIINCTADATIRGFTLTHAVRSSFITVDYPSVDGNPQAAAQDAHKRIKKSKPVYKQEYVLFGSRSGGKELTIKPGQYVYPFSIPIENWVAGTSTATLLGEFSDCCDCCCRCCGGHFLLGGILHSLDVKVVIANSLLDHNFDKEIDVQRAAPNEALSIPRPLDMSYAASAKSCCCGCRGKGQIDLRIRLPRQDWIIGLDTNIVGKFTGRANIPFQLVLLSTTKLSDKMRNKVDFTHRDEIVETKIVRTAYKHHQAGYFDERVNGGQDFIIPIPRDLAPSFGDGNANQIFQASIVYTLVALPLDTMCSFEFENPAAPIVLNMWKALAAPRKNHQPTPPPPQQQHHHHHGHHHHHHPAHHHHHHAHHQQHQHHNAASLQYQQFDQYQHHHHHHHHHHQPYYHTPPPPPQSNFAASGDIPCFEKVYAYNAPPTEANLLPENHNNQASSPHQHHQQQNYNDGGGRSNLKFNPASQVTEMDLEPATWGQIVEAADTVPNNAYQIPPPSMQ